MPTLPFRVPWLCHVFPGKEHSMRVAEFMGEDGPAVYSIWHTPADRTISDGIVQVKLRLWFSDAIGTYWNTQPS